MRSNDMQQMYVCSESIESFDLNVSYHPIDRIFECEMKCMLDYII